MKVYVLQSRGLNDSYEWIVHAVRTTLDGAQAAAEIVSPTGRLEWRRPADGSAESEAGRSGFEWKVTVHELDYDFPDDERIRRIARDLVRKELVLTGGTEFDGVHAHSTIALRLADGGAGEIVTEARTGAKAKAGEP